MGFVLMIDWDWKVEWSSGEEAFLRYAGLNTRLSMEVTGCQEWWDITGDSYVSVDTKTGRILGCEQEDYPFIRNRIPPAPLRGRVQDSVTVSGDREEI